jgi:hypothetical protein
MNRFVQVAVVTAAVVAMGMAGSVAQAGAFDNVNVSYWAGTGSNQTVVVVDFAPGATYAFGYRWDGNAKGWDALSAIDAAGVLNVDATWWDLYQSHFVNDITYPGAVECIGQGWGYFLSADGNSWSESLDGVDRQDLVRDAWNGLAFGFYDANNNWAFSRAPATPFLAAPEPGTLTVLLLAGAGLAARRRRRVG